MPLRDHFRPPLDNLRHWEGFHATWPVMIVALLSPRLPHGYFAEPRVHSGASAEIDVATFEGDAAATGRSGNGNGGVATAVWAPPRPTLSSLNLGDPLPTMPLWVPDDLAVPLDLDDSYERSCEILNIS